MSLPPIKNQNLNNYLQKGFNSIEGWCEPVLFHTVDLINSARINKAGGCCEIGVHHGKLFILLNSIVDPNEKSYAIDVFENQELNIDNSGQGSKTIFRKNLDLYDAHKGTNVEIIQGDSTDSALKLESIIKPGSMRIISIDGGHTAEHTINDLNLAIHMLSNQGIVIIDDILNPYWLGVIEGVTHFLKGRPTLLPVALGHNKLYLAKISYRSYYKNLFSNSPLFNRDVQFFGHTVALV